MYTWTRFFLSSFNQTGALNLMFPFSLFPKKHQLVCHSLYLRALLYLFHRFVNSSWRNMLFENDRRTFGQFPPSASNQTKTWIFFFTFYSHGHLILVLMALLLILKRNTIVSKCLCVFSFKYIAFCVFWEEEAKNSEGMCTKLLQNDACFSFRSGYAVSLVVAAHSTGTFIELLLIASNVLCFSFSSLFVNITHSRNIPHSTYIHKYKGAETEIMIIVIFVCWTLQVRNRGCFTFSSSNPFMYLHNCLKSGSWSSYAKMLTNHAKPIVNSIVAAHRPRVCLWQWTV